MQAMCVAMDSTQAMKYLLFMSLPFDDFLDSVVSLYVFP